VKTMATRKRCKLSRTGPEFENVIKRLLCARTFHTRIGGDLTHGIINRGRLANAEQMGLQGSAQHFNIFPLDLRTQGKKTGVQKREGTDSIPAAGRSGTANQPSIAPHRCLFSCEITASDGLKRGRGCNGAAHLVCGDAWKTELGEPWVSIALALAGLGAILILELSWFVG
uniref:AP20 region protein 1 n=2 Tax=Colobus angolensis palliatus TaxID=336983 RepID=A0A2K5I8I0_COLAP